MGDLGRGRVRGIRINEAEVSMPAIPEIFSKSVTSDDLAEVRNGAILRVIVPMMQGFDRLALPPEPPPYWSYQRDAVMRATVFKEAMWAAAVNIAISKVAASSWAVEGDRPRIVEKYQQMLLEADGSRVGWVGFMGKHLRDYLTTDNGAFVEIVRSGKGPGTEVLGLRHLDSLRCTRTGDPTTPVLYRDKMGAWHEMKDYQVITFADMPDPSDTYYGVGHCAASRAYYSIYKMAAIERYLREKVAGLRPLAIYVVNGVLDTQLKGAIQAAKEEEVARGLVGYMGAVIVGVPDEQQPQVATIPLAELPDRFARKEEFDIAVLTYADVLGLDVQDLQPLTGQSLGSGAQSQILDNKAKGKGLTMWRQDWMHALNTYFLPDKFTFAFTEKDYRDLQLKAGIEATHVTNAVARINAQITTPLQELNMMVDNDEIPREFLPEDLTEDQDIDDTEKLDEGEPMDMTGKLTEAQLVSDARRQVEAQEQLQLEADRTAVMNKVNAETLPPELDKDGNPAPRQIQGKVPVSASPAPVGGKPGNAQDMALARAKKVEAVTAAALDRQSGKDPEEEKKKRKADQKKAAAGKKVPTLSASKELDLEQEADAILYAVDDLSRLILERKLDRPKAQPRPVPGSEVVIDGLFTTKGGPGSGNHGHAGIPGHHGGSAPGGGLPAAMPKAKPKRKRQPKKPLTQDQAADKRRAQVKFILNQIRNKTYEMSTDIDADTGQAFYHPVTQHHPSQVRHSIHEVAVMRQHHAIHMHNHPDTTWREQDGSVTVTDGGTLSVNDLVSGSIIQATEIWAVSRDYYYRVRPLKRGRNNGWRARGTIVRTWNKNLRKFREPYLEAVRQNRMKWSDANLECWHVTLTQTCKDLGLKYERIKIHG